MFKRLVRPFHHSVRAWNVVSTESAAQYTPKVLTEETEVAGSNRPLPLSVELNHYAPLKIPVKHGELRAEITMRSFDNRNLDFFCDFALRAGYYLGLPLTGPKPLETRRERWTVIRAPFVHAKSKENFERRTHARLLRVWDSNPEVVDIWLAVLNKYSVTGVGLKAHMYIEEAVDPDFSASTPTKEGDIDSTGLNIAQLTSSVNPEIAARVAELLKDPEFAVHVGKDTETKKPTETPATPPETS
ncbi:37S ribosomal protein S10, mitochondrial [Komagataella phaffii CBS 7435]|uniref:Small ribosomal subunit protein uS10m n=2 Tax=Komagataella phaffii TaxID=460519 RepID=C4R621_KOMPG|nr:mitochondrial 37S ribosomal protein RSM10 [Komagataella phaffii GS115]AOA63583.1 GQ67_04074T0 [Komagataella phaffii]CAH2449171.1 37S ribosomal protein S10, mitochondrial [Komagataella phaffii CBS 7435]AOA68608.1 GQ68_04047T0 [Komagataella phaffii GS115]CAY71007.1 Mitochondrial ribosomal protein of the small subunit [Komagataella phaffii GS115]CCA39197.1 37S ribosomal protein S10, mitochondrial [Komagataella phaffii CBS 7435]